jgi:hypothetical protein
MLPLALWSAVPGVRWCPLGWDEVRAECFVARTAVVEAGTPGCCERACGETEALCGDPDAGQNCTAPPLASEFPGGRAYCLGGPAGGDGVPPVAALLDSPVLSALLPDAIPATLPERATCPAVVAATHPPPSPVGAVPRERAPPGSGSISC